MRFRQTPLITVIFMLFAVFILGRGTGYGDGQSGITLGILGGPIFPTVSSLPVATRAGIQANLFPEAAASARLGDGGHSRTHIALAESEVAIFPPIPSSEKVAYIVQRGETIAVIARKNGVSTADLISQNPQLKDRKSIRPGESLTINVPAKSLINLAVAGDEDSGSGKTDASRGFMNVSAARAYFKIPADGFNWGKLHNYNAVDIANLCGTTIVAPADGIVVSDDRYGDGSGDWNGGYGRFVLLEHPNGVKTRMAHLEKISVSVGDMVKKGQTLGTMGQTGDATGCHVHFEIIGAPNPFGKS